MSSMYCGEHMRALSPRQACELGDAEASSWRHAPRCRQVYLTAFCLNFDAEARLAV